METAKPTNHQITYLKCHKSGLHQDENINIVCLQKSCLENLIGCCACIEDQHKKHKYLLEEYRTKPLKMFLFEAKQQKQINPPIKINIDIMLDILKEQQKRIFEVFEQYKRGILEQLQNTQRIIQSYFDHTANQILLKNSDTNLIIQQILQRVTSPKTEQDLKMSLKKLVALQCQEQGKNLSQEQLKQSLQRLSLNLEKEIKVHEEDMKGKMNHFQNILKHFIQSRNVWQTNFKFSQKFKHNDIKVVNQKSVKSINSQGYKFALMQPGVDLIGKKTFSFFIKESKSNWIGVGFCDKNTVISKNYTFKFGSIGHGAYMMSSNGGSWSNHKQQHNNTIKGIKFVKGDTIHCTIDSSSSKISFSKNKSSQLCYQLPYQLTQNRQLNPCVLFYYKQDEVQFINKAE